MHSLKLIVPGLLVAAMVSCSHEQFEPTPQEKDAGKIVIQGDIRQVNNTKATATGFTDGDRFAVYIVDYSQDGTPGILVNSGNRADNLKFTFSEPQTWTPDHDVYWRDDHTAIDVYGYYPVANVDDVNNLPFEIAQDQNSDHADGSMSGYESSDFLWGKVSGATVAGGLINILFEHKMACARIRLVEGEGFEDGEWARLQKNVVISNTARKGTIDLATGVATASSEIQPDGIIPQKEGDEFRAVVLPQSISADTKLFTITVNGVNYIFRKNADFEYVPGRMHNFDVEVTKKAAAGDYVFNITSESITAWEIDKKSHDGMLREYVVVNTTPGHLQEDVAASGKNPAEILNLKVVGCVNGSEWGSSDFDFIRNKMTKLQYLNLKEASIEGCVIPPNAFNGKRSLISVIIPESGITTICKNAFAGCSNLSGSLIIPEGVETIESDAFNGCSLLQGTLQLPTTLKTIGTGAFAGCSFHCDLVLPSKLEKIEGRAFSGCKYLTGPINLPESLTSLGGSAFYDAGTHVGSLVIPDGITVIEPDTFRKTHFSGSLSLPANLTEIRENAFLECGFRGELLIPDNVVTLGNSAFEECSFSGSVHLPSELTTMGNRVFANCRRLSGNLVIPSSVRAIGTRAFGQCELLSGVEIPQSLTIIPDQCFYCCYALNRIILSSEIPQTVGNDAFAGVSKDNFPLEVPEGSESLYKNASGWSEFKKITAHHELYTNPMSISCLNSSVSKTILVTAEGDWRVSDCPDWISVSPTSGNGKTEVTVSVNQLSGDNRSGVVSFELVANGYTYCLTVNQYDYQYGDGDVIIAKTATKGRNGGINLVFVGDGFDAKDISEGKYLEVMNKQIDYFFSIEPYAAYKDFFKVSIPVALSTESGIQTASTNVDTKFNCISNGEAVYYADKEAVVDFVTSSIPSLDNQALSRSLIVLTPNCNANNGMTYMFGDDLAISICPMSVDESPYDQEGVVHHEACGHGFGKLADEFIYHAAFIYACGCNCHPHTEEVVSAKSHGWYDNLSLTGNVQEVPWSHMIFDPRYRNSVDVYEGGFYHSRGIFRSEHMSCMYSNIPYFSAISRESIVRRIMSYSGETFDYEDFVEKDLASLNATSMTKSSNQMLEASFGVAPSGHIAPTFVNND